MNPVIKTKDVPKGWAPEVSDLINNLISRKEENRLGKSGSKAIKNHAWFKDINWDNIINRTYNPPFKPRNVCIFNIKTIIKYYFKLFIILKIEDYFDESYLESFEKNEKLLIEISNAEKLLRNPNTHRQFKDYYFDKDKQLKTQIKSTNPSTINTGKTTLA